ncbi:exo-beta-N-acetylmuramidase NamZ family protein [Tautonia plasticadhaerens]|uniref:DUF1343 domain-containing protein n=1 Tax=Tautonia plasticadhaerens TaxID=2527974 RepID=A0A518GYC4_9BACT|nr:DUF1343 domain-containing protein [Tautonia plasticadhaerens]QDV33596.1 hypothetical protein ElP_14700 [Tautonia plasticadhaerens]
MIGESPRVATGLDSLVEGRFARLRGRKVGLIANQSAVDRRYRHAIDLLHDAPGVELARLFGPEHGLRGEAQDMEGVGSGSDRRTGLPVVSLYGEGPESLSPGREDLAGLDLIVFDVQDVGARYYTFAASMFYAMEAASRAGCGFLVLDRPNPLGGAVVEGPTVGSGFESFVGAYPMPIRHGMTIGELARLYRDERRLDLDLDVAPCSGWTRDQLWDETGLAWIPPSPNMPTAGTAVVYPGACLIEGTNLSEGRGTTRPFEFWGAPWLEEASYQMVEEMSGQPGAGFRPIAFRPKFQKLAGETCFGVQPVVEDPRAFSGLETYLKLLLLAVRADPGRFSWRTEPYEFIRSPIAIDLLFGSALEREAIEQAAREPDLDLEQWCLALKARWGEDSRSFVERRGPALLYEGSN